MKDAQIPPAELISAKLYAYIPIKSTIAAENSSYQDIKIFDL